jgi:hypothetical protein
MQTSSATHGRGGICIFINVRSVIIDLTSKNIIGCGFTLDGDITVISDSDEYHYLNNAWLNNTPLNGIFKDQGFYGTVLVCGVTTFANEHGIFATFQVRNIDV